jgi:hypothetical protein
MKSKILFVDDEPMVQRLLSQLGSLPSPISTSNWSPN